MCAEILHVVQRLARGGAGRALMSLAHTSGDSGDHTHRVLSLVEPDTPTAKVAADRGLQLHAAADRETTARLVAAADVVHVHFWNTPELYEFLRMPLPACRVVLWSHVNGASAPHVITDNLAEYPDAFVATAAATLDLPSVQRGFPVTPPAVQRDSSAVPSTVIRPGPDLRRATSGRRLPDGPFTVGVFGSLDAARVDPQLLDVFAALPGGESQLLVVGAGDAVPAMQQRAADLGIADRITWVGFAEDVGAYLARMDVALHLLRPDCSATSDLALQELMAASVVPIVSAGTPPADLVRHGIDGFAAADADAAAVTLRLLAADRPLRQRLGAEAHRRALREFQPLATAAAFHDLYARVLELPRREHTLGGGDRSSGASGPLGRADKSSGQRGPVGPMATEATRLPGWRAFTESLGGYAEPFRCSAAGSQDCDIEAADRWIADSPPALVGAGAGGVLHYRGYYPHDPVLRYWAGLIWARGGRPALAAAEFAFARSAGFDPPRVQRHLAGVLSAARGQRTAAAIGKGG